MGFGIPNKGRAHWRSCQVLLSSCFCLGPLRVSPCGTCLVQPRQHRVHGMWANDSGGHFYSCGWGDGDEAGGPPPRGARRECVHMMSQVAGTLAAGSSCQGTSRSRRLGRQRRLLVSRRVGEVGDPEQATRRHVPYLVLQRYGEEVDAGRGHPELPAWGEGMRLRDGVEDSRLPGPLSHCSTTRPCCHDHAPATSICSPGPSMESILGPPHRSQPWWQSRWTAWRAGCSAGPGGPGSRQRWR